MLDGFALHEMIFNQNDRPIDYRLLKENPAFGRLTGLKGGNIVGKTVLEGPNNIEKYWIDKYGDVAISCSPIRFENYSHEFDKYYEVNAYKPEEGQFTCVFKDITQ